MKRNFFNENSKYSAAKHIYNLAIKGKISVSKEDQKLIDYYHSHPKTIKTMESYTPEL